MQYTKVQTWKATDQWVLCLALCAIFLCSLGINLSHALITAGLLLGALSFLIFVSTRWPRESLHSFKNIPKSAHALMAYILIAAVSVWLHRDYVASAWDNLDELKIPLIFVVLTAILTHLRFAVSHEFFLTSLKVISFSIGIGFVLANISGLYEMFAGSQLLRSSIEQSPSHRLRGPLFEVSTHGHMSLFVLVVTGGYLLYSSRGQKLQQRLIIFLHVMGLVGLVLTGMRSCVLAYMTVLLFFLFFKSWRIFKLAAGASVLVLLIAIGTILSGGSESTRFLQSFDSRSNTIRLSQYQAALKMIQENSWKGVGYSAFHERLESIKNRHELPHPDYTGNSHNIFLEAWSELGIFGFLAFTSFLGLWFYEALKRWRSKLLPGLGGAALVISVIVTGMFHALFVNRATAVAVFLLYLLNQLYLEGEQSASHDV